MGCRVCGEAAGPMAAGPVHLPGPRSPVHRQFAVPHRHDPPPGQPPVSRPAARRHPPRPGLGPDAALRLSRPRPLPLRPDRARPHPPRRRPRARAARSVPTSDSPRQTPGPGLFGSDRRHRRRDREGRRRSWAPPLDRTSSLRRPVRAIFLRSRKWTLPGPLSSRDFDAGDSTVFRGSVPVNPSSGRGADRRMRGIPRRGRTNQPSPVDHHIDAIVADVRLSVDQLERLLDRQDEEVDGGEDPARGASQGAEIAPAGPPDLAIEQPEKENLPADLCRAGDGHVATLHKVGDRLNDSCVRAPKEPWTPADDPITTETRYLSVSGNAPPLRYPEGLIPGKRAAMVSAIVSAVRATSDGSSTRLGSSPAAVSCPWPESQRRHRSPGPATR